MNNVITFPQKDKRPLPLPRQRVFYIGYRYVGPMLCQEVQNLYLKRKGFKHGKIWVGEEKLVIRLLSKACFTNVMMNEDQVQWDKDNGVEYAAYTMQPMGA